MSIGKSGRIVIEIDPELKKRLYGELTSRGLSLKEWFLDSAIHFLSNPTKGVQNKHTKKDPQDD